MMRRTNGPQRAEAIRNAELVLQMMVEMDKDIFELARLVNPPKNVESQPIITHDAGYTIVQSEHCYSAWPTDNDELAAGHVRQWQQRVEELKALLAGSTEKRTTGEMTLREWYAGQALRRMQGGSDAHVARNCFALADAMVTESQARKWTGDATQRPDERGERGGE